MAKRRVKRTAQQSLASCSNDTVVTGKEPQVAEEADKIGDQEAERQIVAIRAISDMEIEHLLTRVRLLRSYFSEKQLQLPALQFFEENLPNLSVVQNRKDGQFDLLWKEEGDNLAVNNEETRDFHASVLHHMTMAYPDLSAAMPSFSGLEFSSKAVKTSLLGADTLQIGKYLMEEPSDMQMFGMQDSLQTPGVNSQRMSIGMTPKTLRLPKHGEMLLSVRGSPLGIYKEDNMEAICESG
ncbi:hypothetical protein Nepgr_010147 [Nepenthes gracilis]|uniref:Borealin C-terminal domain-containing protein n=1 Tax=Nepenthes gracilis TaxID=150966 RepID=A0AAD3XKS8_NEPGR|nr:hypothetical protein Nepgr_010147 [Nepenthes gracilis]